MFIPQKIILPTVHTSCSILLLQNFVLLSDHLTVQHLLHFQEPEILHQFQPDGFQAVRSCLPAFSDHLLFSEVLPVRLCFPSKRALPGILSVFPERQYQILVQMPAFRWKPAGLCGFRSNHSFQYNWLTAYPLIR